MVQNLILELMQRRIEAREAKGALFSEKVWFMLFRLVIEKFSEKLRMGEILSHMMKPRHYLPSRSFVHLFLSFFLSRFLLATFLITPQKKKRLIKPKQLRLFQTDLLVHKQGQTVLLAMSYLCHPDVCVFVCQSSQDQTARTRQIHHDHKKGLLEKKKKKERELLEIKNNFFDPSLISLPLIVL